MKKAKLQHDTYGEIRIIISDGEVYLCAMDLADGILGGKRNAISLYKHSNNRIKFEYGEQSYYQMCVFIPESECIECILKSTFKTEERTNFLQWLSNELEVIHNESSAKSIDIIQNPDIGIKLLTELKKEREVKEKIEAELKAEREKRLEAERCIEEYKSKAKFTDNVMKLISDMREKAAV